MSTRPESHQVADQLLHKLVKASLAERETFAGTHTEAKAMGATEDAYQALIRHLDANGLTGSYWDPRGGKDED